MDKELVRTGFQVAAISCGVLLVAIVVSANICKRRIETPYQMQERSDIPRPAVIKSN